MKLKSALLRGLLGVPLGVFIGYTITILVSVSGSNSGEYAPVVPQLTHTIGSEIAAVILQYILSAILGFAFAIGSAVFEVEQWSITRQTVIHFCISTISMFPIAYFCYWMDHSFWGIMSYIGIFVVLYIIIWAIQMHFWEKRIKGINQKLQGK